MTRLLTAVAVVAALTLSAAAASAAYPYKNSTYGYQPYQNRVQYPVGGWNGQNYGAAFGGYGTYMNHGAYGTNYRANYGAQNYNYGNVRTFQYGGYPVNNIQVIPLNGGNYNIPGVGTASGFQNVIVLPPGATVQGFCN